jgi:biotin carboxyl carrier protein
MGKIVSIPMEGKVVKINVKVGDSVQPDQEVMIMEAMKMEMPVPSEHSGVVKSINVAVGQTFAPDTALIELE